MQTNIVKQSTHPLPIGYVNDRGDIFLRAYDEDDRAMRICEDGISCDYWEESEAKTFLYPGDEVVLKL